MEELRMLTQTDIERERYESRIKAQRNQNGAMTYARVQGEQMGKEIGEKIGIIRTCEMLLQRPQTPREQLLTLPLEELTRLAEELGNQALNPAIEERPASASLIAGWDAGARLR